MSALNRFDPPANVTDLSDPAKDQLLRAEWSNDVNRWTETAILGNPWMLSTIKIGRTITTRS